jgi:UDP-glucose 4-epimerase
MQQKMESNKKIVITGVSGFIGKNLSIYLKSKGYQIIGIDIVGKGENCDYFYLGSFNDKNIAEKALNGAEVVFHLGSIVGVDKCQNEPELVRQINFSETVSFFDTCVKIGVKKIVFSSSSEIYGNSKDLPYKEDAVVTPISLYAQCKRDVEAYLKTISETTDVKVCIPRFFNVYGPGQRADFVVTKFINLVKNNQNIEIYGTGLQTRSHTYIGDVVNALEKMISYNKNSYEIINIGSTFEYNMNEVAKTILDLFPNSKSKVEYVNYGSNGTRDIFLEIDRRVPLTTKAEKILSFKATTDLKEGIEKIIKSIT